jgi:hypothetical protein
MPDGAAQFASDEVARLIEDLADRALAGKAGRGLGNGDTLRTLEIRDSGMAAVQRLVSCDWETGERQYSPVFLYGDFQNFDLGYTVTTHSTQGRTVTTSAALVLRTESRHWLYTVMSRGARGNSAIVASSPPKIADRARNGGRARAGAVRADPSRARRLRAAGTAARPSGNPRRKSGSTGILADEDHLTNLYIRWQGKDPGCAARPVRARAASLLRLRHRPGRKTDPADGHAIVMVALRDKGLRELSAAPELVVLRMLRPA